MPHQGFQLCVCSLILKEMCLLSSAEWSQRDLERNENVKFCRQYIVFHDDKSVVYAAASGNCTEIKGEYVNICVILSLYNSDPEQMISHQCCFCFFLSDC